MRSKHEMYTQIEHTLGLRGSRHAYSDYITRQVLRPPRGVLRAGTRASLASLTTTAAHKMTAEAHAEENLKLLMKPLNSG